MCSRIHQALDTKVNPLLHVTPNVEMNVNLMEQSWRNKVRKFIFISSNTTYPDIGDEYCTEDISVQTVKHISRLQSLVGWMKRYCETLCDFFSNQIHDSKCIIIDHPWHSDPNDKYDFEKCHVTHKNIRKVAR